jgi:beta-phosphoglucomutase-like phosphatase (HAD superfamily)
VIVRIATEDQYELADEHAERLNQLDNAIVDAVKAGNQDTFHQLLAEMLALVRDKGHQVDGDDLRESEVILPPPDITLEEAAEEFSGEGLIPG